MNSKKITPLVFAIVSGLCISLTACASSNELQTKYGKNAYYFMALQNQQNGNSTDAERFFRSTSKKSSPLFARLADQELCNYGTRPQQLQRSLDFHKKYNDEDSLLFACQKLFERNEYSSIIKITADINLATSNDEVSYYRIASLYRRNDAHFGPEFIKWSNSRPWTQNHYRLYCESNIQDPICALRSYVYTRDYGKAYNAAVFILDNMETYGIKEIPLVASDLGKAFIYGSSAYYKNAVYFESLTEKFSPLSQFYITFYTGRLYSKAGAYYTKAQNSFLKAMELSTTDALYDNALYYYLESCLSSSIKDAVNAIAKYAPTFHEADYYDTFFEALSLRICSKRLWEDFYFVAKSIQGYASKEMCSKYNYLTARLVDEGYLKSSKTNGILESELNSKELYTKALDSGTSVYYRMLAARALNLSDEDILELFYNNIISSSEGKSFEADTEVETLFYGLIDFGLSENLYEKWQVYGTKLGTECTTYIASFIRKNAKEDSQDFTKSLRIASRKVNRMDEKISRELLELMYPQNFESFVTEACNSFKEKEHVMYGLIRSESFFDPAVVSSADAKGLTQIMDLTAGDIARKLKVADYDLTDPKTNITFGTFYLSDLTRLFDGNDLLAIFSYNGGRSNVRSWVKSANIEFGSTSLPLDLFLEVIPFTETREYGRKVVSAAAMYGMLYYNTSGKDVVTDLIF